MNLIDYDKVHAKLIDEWEKAMAEGANAEGLMDAIHILECAEIYTDWDDRKKLIQPHASDQDYSMVNSMIEGLIDYLECNEAEGSTDTCDWIQDWLKDFMFEYDIKPTDLLMESKK